MKVRTKYKWTATRRSIKKAVRKRYKKSMLLTDVDKIWADYVEYAIVRPLIKYGRVQVDKTLSLEIVGTRIESNKRVANLMAKGKYVRNGMALNIDKINHNRLGYVYSVKVTDTIYNKGVLIADIHPNLKKRVSEHLFNTFQQYRIVA